MKLLLSLLSITLFFAMDALAQKANLTDADIQAAIDKGMKEKKSYGLTLCSVIGFGRCADIFTPTTRIENEASKAAKEFRTISVKDIDPDLTAPVLFVVANPRIPDHVNDPCLNTSHVVIRDVSKKIVIQPEHKESFESSASNAFGAKVTCSGVMATFSLDKLNDLRSKSEKREFLITMIDQDMKSDVKVKEKFFDALP